MVYFTKVFTDATNYFIREYDDSLGVGWNRAVPETYQLFIDWVAQGNTPTLISGNKYVTINGTSVTFDTVAKAADDKEVALTNLKESYTPQFNELSNAYMKAVILNDTITMSESRTAYQALLEEYNNKVGAL